MNTHINKNRKQPSVSRAYTGVTITAENYKQILKDGGRDAINYHTRHLEAYINGYELFSHGIRRDEEGRPVAKRWHKVQQKLTTIE